jgi:hypothetical protein
VVYTHTHTHSQTHTPSHYTLTQVQANIMTPNFAQLEFAEALKKEIGEYVCACVYVCVL